MLKALTERNSRFTPNVTRRFRWPLLPVLRQRARLDGTKPARRRSRRLYAFWIAFSAFLLIGAFAQGCKVAAPGKAETAVMTKAKHAMFIGNKAHAQAQFSLQPAKKCRRWQGRHSPITALALPWNGRPEHWGALRRHLMDHL